MDFKCSYCEKKFKTKEALNQHTFAKHTFMSSNPANSTTDPTKKFSKSLARFVPFLVLTILLFSLTFFFAKLINIKTLPPIDTINHVEDIPPLHIMKRPMKIEVQKHMLEHADGFGQPGVIINYDCKNYSCSDNLVQHLENFALKYSFVYVVPWRNMKAKIVLTRLGKRLILDSYDAEKIENFIKGVKV